MNKGILIGVGIGPGHVKYLTLDAVEALRTADIIVDVAGPRSRESISEKIINDLGGCSGERVHFITPMSRNLAERERLWDEKAEQVKSWLCDGKKVAYVTLGDPLIYSTFGYLRRALLTLDAKTTIKVIPGITSFQAAAAHTGEVLLENDEVLALLPANFNKEKLPDLLQHVDTAAVLKASKNKKELFDSVNTALESKAFLFATRMEQPDEAFSIDPDEAAQMEDTYLSLFISKRNNHDA